jgi:filamentous hemagglutinin family protein
MRQFLPRLELVSSITLGYLVTISAATAQIVPDNTLPVNSSVTPGCTICTIDGGTVRGVNLFHSFSEFSVPTGGEANFNNGLQIQNIFSRVTGNSVSNIDGLLRTNGTASLFFLNPNGIIFGPNAQLNIGGSFLASTASSFKFPDGSEFSATNPTAPPLLIINLRPGLQYGSSQPGATITNSGNLAAGEDLTLVAEKLDLQGQLQAGRDLALQATDTVKVYDTAANPFIASSGGKLLVQGNQGVDIFALNHLDSGLFSSGDITITSEAGTILVNGGEINSKNYGTLKGGDINITAIAGSIFLRNGAVLNASTVGQGNAGSVNINAADIVSFDNSEAFSRVEQGAVGNSGGIKITTGSLAVTGGAVLSASTLGKGKAGSVIINARDRVAFDGIGSARDRVAFDGIGSNKRSSGAYSAVGEAGIGDGGDINITTGSLALTGGAVIAASTFGKGKAGSVIINARDRVAFDGVGSNRVPSGAQSAVVEAGIGDGGDINITTGSLALTGGAVLNASTFGEGNAGSVNINAADIVSFDNSEAFSRVEQGAVGNSGGIKITTGSLAVTGGAVLSASTLGKGKAGSVIINARDRVAFDGIGSARDRVAFDGIGSNKRSSGAYSAVGEAGIGDGGDINITTGSLALTGGAVIAASTFGKGKADSVIINARDRVAFDGVGSNGISSGAYSSVEEGGKSDGGDIKITTGSLAVTGGAVVSARTRGQGNGGNITVRANTMDAANGGQVLTSSFGTGEAGDINLNVTQRITFSGSDPTYLARLAQFGPGIVDNVSPASGVFANTLSTSTNRGGDLTITTGQLTVRDGSQVSVKSEGTRNAGNLNLTANSVLLDNQGQLIAETASGGDGNINLQVEDLLLMRHNSLISAKATGDADGGNVNIETKFLIAIPPDGTDGSDIIASAQQGSGGKIDIDAAGIFGLEERRAIPGNRTNDIDASSEFGSAGQVTLSTLINPSQGLSQLPTQLVDPTRKIDSSCAARGDNESKFTVTGRGGLPSTPNDLLTSDQVLDDFGTLATANPPASEPVKPVPSSPPKQLVEAQGWIIAADGQVILTAQAPSVTPHSSPLTPASCQHPQN